MFILFRRERIVCLLLLILTTPYLSGAPDTLNPKLKPSFYGTLNSDGIASIPAFSLGKPAFILSPGLALGRLSYDPCLAYGLDLRPWYIDSWIHYMVIRRPVFNLRTGFNFSNFFSEYKLPDETIHQVQRYWDFEIAGFFNFPRERTLSLLFWTDNGQDRGTISGRYYSISAEQDDIPLGNSLRFSAFLQLFIINYTGDNDGLFVCPRIALSTRNFPVSVFLQVIQPIATDIKPDPGLRMNGGVAIEL